MNRYLRYSAAAFTVILLEILFGGCSFIAPGTLHEELRTQIRDIAEEAYSAENHASGTDASSDGADFFYVRYEGREGTVYVYSIDSLLFATGTELLQ